MSADNYLLIREDATVWHGFASDDRVPWETQTDPDHVAVSVSDAVTWAQRYCHEEIVEYGYSLIEEAAVRLEQEQAASVLGDVTSRDLRTAANEVRGHPGRIIQNVADLLDGLADRSAAVGL